MTDAPRDHRSIPSLEHAPWLHAPATRAVFEALSRAGHEGRVVGGAVRNEMMGLPVADIDIATPAEPAAVIDACAAAGLKPVPTGLQHGTVTVVVAGKAIEVTTLRRDVDTDGRHATVAFTADWHEDADRRDFTMNALYCDAAGRVYDPVGGYPDIVARRVRFIGNADARIAEDYLRILRFFRFHAAYAHGAPEPDAIAACARGVAGMTRLSAERIRAELVKLLVAPGALGALQAMTGIGLLSFLLGAAPRPGVFGHLVDAERALGLAPDPMSRLSALALACPDDIERLGDRLRLSNAERAALLVFDQRFADGLAVDDAAAARRWIYRHGAGTSRRHALALATVAHARLPEARRLLAEAGTWARPRLPVGGSDLISAGVPPGPRIGALLAEVETWWIENDFPGEAAVRARLREIVSREPGGG